METPLKLAQASAYWAPLGSKYMSNPWSPDDYDKLDTFESNDYHNVVNDCRFFYKRDPLASTTINKIVDIGVTDIIIDQGTLTDNEYKILIEILPRIQEFIELGVLEYLISGLVIPEIEYQNVTLPRIKQMGIKRYSTLMLPEVMWYRDSSAVTINSPLIPSLPAYYIKIPEDLCMFILNKGKNSDGTEDKELYETILTLYPELVAAILKGTFKIKLENDNIIRRRYLSNSPYPLPYLYSALESLRHKRNIRRMDYSIASRVVGAIQLIRLGDKDFPLTLEDSDQLDYIRDQLRHRESTYGSNVERVYQLFGNHTLDISWVFPNMEALLDESKYNSVNADILFALGFPRVLSTGETQRTGTSESDIAILSPIKTMNEFRRKFIYLAKNIIYEILRLNHIKRIPSDIRFSDINLYQFNIFVDALIKLHDTGAVSKTTLTSALGFDYTQETKNRKSELELREKYGLTDFDATPFSPTPEKTENPKKDVNND